MTRAEPVRPFADTRTAKFIDEKIESLKGVKSQRDIALALGYEKPNVLSMIKRGETKLPIDKIPALAEAIEVDPAHLMRMALHDYTPKLADAIEHSLGHIATRNEFELLLKPWRMETADADPSSVPELAAEVRALVKSIFKKGADS